MTVFLSEFQLAKSVTYSKTKLHKTIFPCSLPFSVVTLIIKRVIIP